MPLETSETKVAVALHGLDILVTFSGSAIGISLTQPTMVSEGAEAEGKSTTQHV